MGTWQIILKENDKKILTGTGKTVLIALYKFIGLLYIKGLFCDHDFNKLGNHAAKNLLSRK